MNPPGLKKTFGGAIAVILFVLLLLGISVFFIMQSDSYQTKQAKNEMSVSELRGEAKEYDYIELSRFPREHAGTIVIFEGVVLQNVRDNAVRVELVQQPPGGSASGIVYVGLRGAQYDGRIIENDLIQVLGIADGLHSYNSAIGSVTLPKVRGVEVTVNP